MSEPEKELIDELDFAHFKDLVGLILRAPRRRPLLAAFSLALGIGATGLAFVYTPRTYLVQTRILALRNLILPSLGNPRRAVPTDADAPTRAASETILRQDNLRRIMAEAELEPRWDTDRPAILRLKDRVMGSLFGAISKEDKERAILGLLEKKLGVQTNESTVTISIEWQNPEMAFRLVSLAEKSFLNARNNVEVSMIAEAIKILEVEAKKQRDDVDLGLKRVLDLDDRSRVEGETEALRPAAPAPTPAPAPANRVSAADLEKRRQVTAELERTRQSIRALEESKSRRVAALRAQLTDLLLTYAPGHPSVIALEATIKEASEDGLELSALKREESAFAAELERLPKEERRPVATVRRVSNVPGTGAVIVNAQPREDTPELAAAKDELEAATRKYEDLLDRIDAARIELHTAEAAFKYRYSVIEPAEVPKKAKKPKLQILLAGGLFLSLFMAIFAAAARDLLSGRFIESWQVKRKLGLAILGELDKP